MSVITDMWRVNEVSLKQHVEDSLVNIWTAKKKKKISIQIIEMINTNN